MGERPTPTHSIDRTDNGGNYSCGKCDDCKRNGWSSNVRWATPKTQSNNRGIVYKVEINGQVVSLKEACRINGLPYKQVHERVKRGGWDINVAVSTPIGKPHSYKKIKK